MIKDLLTTFGLTTTQLKVFVFSFVAVAVMVTLEQMGVRSPISLF